MKGKENKTLENIAWAIEGLILHSNGMKKEFFDGKHEHLSLHCKALKDFIKEIEDNLKSQ